MSQVTTHDDQVQLDTNHLEKIFERAKKPRIRLDNWGWSRGCLSGDASNHPLLGNAFIRTSKVVFIDEIQGIAETKNTVYELGKKL